MGVAVECSQRHSLRETVVAQILIDIAQELIVSPADESETTAQTRQSVELRQGARDDEVVVFLNQRSDIGGVRRDKAGISLVDEHHRVRGDILHDAANLVRSQTITRGVVG